VARLLGILLQQAFGLVVVAVAGAQAAGVEGAVADLHAHAECVSLVAAIGGVFVTGMRLRGSPAALPTGAILRRKAVSGRAAVRNRVAGVIVVLMAPPGRRPEVWTVIRACVDRFRQRTRSPASRPPRWASRNRGASELTHPTG